MSFTIKEVAGPGLAPYLEALAHLRIVVFRDFPYLYDGSREYEQKYLETYLRSSESVTILALDGERVVGASTGLPLVQETAEFQAPFRAAGHDPTRLFYCGESVLLKEYRGRGIYRRFFQGREDHARRVGNFEQCVFCCVQRPNDHPLRPRDYVPLDGIWRHFGYEEQPGLRTEFRWKDIDQSAETAKLMIFWSKTI